MKGHSEEQGTTAGDIRQSLRTCTMQIKGFGKTCQWWQALEIFKDVQQHGRIPDVIMHTALISVLVQGKQREQALERFKEMQK